MRRSMAAINDCFEITYVIVWRRVPFIVLLGDERVMLRSSDGG
jgi:hypothetical protein